MGGHHKKNLRAEKAKVKLKGAKLPKGLNVTKTDFKVRKIEIREQLKESAILASNGERHLNLKETLSRLKHHNLKFRTDAMRNVRDAVKVGQAGHLIGHLNELFQGVAGGVLDQEREVRREACKTLDVLLEALPVEAVVPFFHIIAAYLRCAMTHVQPTIQEDSLQLLDVLLLRVPAGLLAERSGSTIIAHFIDMISRTRHDTQHTNRLLTVRLPQGQGQQGQQTTIKWRTKVLLRLQQLLATMLQQHSRSEVTASSTNSSVHWSSEPPQFYNVLSSWQLDTRGYQQILGARLRQADTEQLRGHVEQLMPLLQDNWLEVRPQQQQQGQQSQSHEQQLLLSLDAAESLHVLLDIMTQLWQLVQHQESTQQQLQHTQPLSTWLRQTYAASFERNFLHQSSFPYQRIPQSVASTTNSRKSKKSKQSGELCYAQNLSLVQLVCHFYPQPDEAQLDLYTSLLLYMSQCLRQLRQLQPDEQLRLVAALRALLLDNGAALLQLQPHQMGAVMYNCIEAYVAQKYATREGCATRVLNLLCQIVQRRQLYEAFGGEQQFVTFLNYLPQLLLKPSVADATLTAMSSLARQCNEVFLVALAAQLQPVLANLEQLQVTGELNSDESRRFEQQKRILNLFYYAREKCDANSLQLASKQLEQQATERVASYFKSLLSYD